MRWLWDWEQTFLYLWRNNDNLILSFVFWFTRKNSYIRLAMAEDNSKIFFFARKKSSKTVTKSYISSYFMFVYLLCSLCFSHFVIFWDIIWYFDIMILFLFWWVKSMQDIQFIRSCQMSDLWHQLRFVDKTGKFVILLVKLYLSFYLCFMLWK